MAFKKPPYQKLAVTMQAAFNIDNAKGTTSNLVVIVKRQKTIAKCDV